MSDTPAFTHTVYCFSNSARTKNFTDRDAAIKYANSLLKQKEMCKLYPYRPLRSYVDILAERGPNG